MLPFWRRFCSTHSSDKNSSKQTMMLVESDEPDSCSISEEDTIRTYFRDALDVIFGRALTSGPELGL